MPLNERTINSARNPKWSDSAHSAIELEVDFDELDEEYVEFKAHPDDIVSWGPELFNRAVAGEFGTVAEFEPPADIVGDDALERVREFRNDVLRDIVDPIVSNPLRWESLTDAQKQEFRDYRQALLDLPSTQASAYLTYNEETGQMDWVNFNKPEMPEQP